LKVTHRDHNGDGSGGQKKAKKVNRKVVHHHGVRVDKCPLQPSAVAFRLGLKILNLENTSRGEQHADKRSDGVCPFPLGGYHQVNQQDPQGKQGQQDDGQRQQVIGGGEK